MKIFKLSLNRSIIEYELRIVNLDIQKERINESVKELENDKTKTFDEEEIKNINETIKEETQRRRETRKEKEQTQLFLIELKTLSSLHDSEQKQTK
jgi:hypothetical protein